MSEPSGFVSAVFNQLSPGVYNALDGGVCREVEDAYFGGGGGRNA